MSRKDKDPIDLTLEEAPLEIGDGSDEEYKDTLYFESLASSAHRRVSGATDIGSVGLLNGKLDLDAELQGLKMRLQGMALGRSTGAPQAEEEYAVLRAHLLSRDPAWLSAFEKGPEALEAYLAGEGADAERRGLEAIKKLHDQATAKGVTRSRARGWEDLEVTQPGVPTSRLASKPVLGAVPIDMVLPNSGPVPYAPVSSPLLSTRGKIGLALGALFAAGLSAAAVKAYLNPETPDDRACVSADTLDDRLVETPSTDPTVCEGSGDATTLYAQVQDTVRSQEEVSNYSPKQETLLTAHTTKTLVSDHFSDAHSWKDLRGAWKNDSLPLVVDKLETWGGYTAVLASLASSPNPITTIDGALAYIAADSALDLPGDPYNSDQTALALAKEIALIKDTRIAADPDAPQGHLDEMAPQEVELAVAEGISNPPPVPTHFTYPEQLSAAQAATLYDAPEPANLQIVEAIADEDLEEITLDEEEITAGPLAPMLSDPTAVPEPLHVKPMKVEPTFTADEEAFFKTEPATAPVPAKTFTEKAKEAVTGWGKKLSGWFRS